MRHIYTRYLIRIPALWFCIFLFCSADIVGQNAVSVLKRQGDRAFEAAQYRSAIKFYRQGGLENSKDKQVRIRIGVCQYEINDVDNAIKTFQSLINEGKTEVVVFYHAARCYQSKSLFADAISLYKHFLQKCKPDDPLQHRVKDELIRCSNGARLKYADEQAYVENAGTAVNSQFAEFGVRTSPTTIDKIYFNSDRDDIERGKGANGNVDIYGTTLINGRWTTPAPLPAHINTAGYDEVCGFSSDGQILYYLGPQANRFIIKTDTFSGESGATYKGLFTGPYPHDMGGTDLIFFNDSICLFSSNRPGGFGGYDLYISLLRNGTWTTPSNLGQGINTFYDERYPFLTRNGLTLLYSSNGLASMGGYDIFISSFDPGTHSWSHSSNAGFPINSPLDDTHMVLSPDGMTAYLSSDRKEGYGEEDIYRVFFKQPFIAHQNISVSPTFYHLLSQGTDGHTAGGSTAEPFEIKEYYVSHLFFDENADILTPQNIKKLDILANLLLIYPKIDVELSCFELPNGQRTFNLYFSIKKAEKAAEYLVGKGIGKNRILLKGFGASFPLVAKPASGATPSPVYAKLNQRLEITVHNYEKEPVIIHLEHIQVPENVTDAKGTKYTTLRHQLFYSIQIASLTQILQNQDLESVDELFIEVDKARGNYLYMAGMASTYKEAEKWMSKMIDLGFPDAHIVPYVDGIRLPVSSIPEWAKTYPDLLFYLSGTKK